MWNAQYMMQIAFSIIHKCTINIKMNEMTNYILDHKIKYSKIANGKQKFLSITKKNAFKNDIHRSFLFKFH